MCPGVASSWQYFTQSLLKPSVPFCANNDWLLFFIFSLSVPWLDSICNAVPLREMVYRARSDESNRQHTRSCPKLGCCKHGKYCVFFRDVAASAAIQFCVDPYACTDAQAHRHTLEHLATCDLSTSNASFAVHNVFRGDTPPPVSLLFCCCSAARSGFYHGPPCW